MIEYILLGVVALLAVLSVVNIALSLKNKREVDKEYLASAIRQSINVDLQNITARIKETNDMQINLIKSYNEIVSTKMGGIGDMQQKQLEAVEKSLKQLSNTNENKLDKLIADMNTALEKITKVNEQKLEQMRQTVDEKLNESLNKRLTESFEMINKSLESVSGKLGEMKSLESGMGDLRKMLSGVKNRGNFGESQLESLLEQFLSPFQFKKNVGIKPDSQERVDFAIVLPTMDEKEQLLPIDAKFPIEDYVKIQNAVENADKELLKISISQLEKRIKLEAKKIKEKYINVPDTTDFALMYLPIEGLYSEALRINGLFEYVQREYKVTFCGPTTLSALLNTYQMGFRTITIQKRSSEIVSMLTVFKKEFGTFVELLSKTQKKIDEASASLSGATKRTEKIQKQLIRVSDLTIDDSQVINYDLSIDDNVENDKDGEE